MKVESPLPNAGVNDMHGHGELRDLLAGADDMTRAIVEAGFSRLRTHGMEQAASFLSFNMTKLRASSRAGLRDAEVQADTRDMATAD